ncbi:MAG TPA: hypothetical protein VFO60_08750, partial [Candidatus Dormibacteraeota bacterium]|nr:hypothetical protein [Candidatus Dormibacteraeota bacterium]
PAVWHHITGVAQTIATSMRSAFPSERVGLLAVGLEVPHVHLHVLPIDRPDDTDFRNAQASIPPGELAAVAARLRVQLAADGHAANAVA